MSLRFSLPGMRKNVVVDKTSRMASTGMRFLDLGLFTGYKELKGWFPEDLLGLSNLCFNYDISPKWFNAFFMCSSAFLRFVFLTTVETCLQYESQIRLVFIDFFLVIIDNLCVL